MLMLNGSGVGVRTAPKITLSNNAYLHLLRRNFEFIIPTLANANKIIGSKNVEPHIAIIINEKEMKLSILMLVEIMSFPKPNKKLSVEGTTKK